MGSEDVGCVGIAAEPHCVKIDCPLLPTWPKAATSCHVPSPLLRTGCTGFTRRKDSAWGARRCGLSLGCTGFTRRKDSACGARRGGDFAGTLSGGGGVCQAPYAVGNGDNERPCDATFEKTPGAEGTKGCAHVLCKAATAASTRDANSSILRWWAELRASTTVRDVPSVATAPLAKCVLLTTGVVNIEIGRAHV